MWVVLLCFVNGKKMVADEKKGLKSVDKKKYELLAPDGGWGYLVAISAIISFVSKVLMFFYNCII